MGCYYGRCVLFRWMFTGRAVTEDLQKAFHSLTRTENLSEKKHGFIFLPGLEILL